MAAAGGRCVALARHFHLKRQSICAVLGLYQRSHALTHPPQAQKTAGGFTVWDYHVIAFKADGLLVYDFDSVAAFPAPLARYADSVLQTAHMAGLPPDAASRFQRRYRVIPRQAFLAGFSSDRSHMRDTQGAYLAAPPPHAPILAPGIAHNLDQYIDMTPGRGPGLVCTSDAALISYLESLKSD